MTLRFRRHLLAILATSLAFTAAFAPVAAEPVAARDGSTFVRLVNDYRAAHGVGAVSLHSVVDQISVERANQMAAARSLSHDLEYVKARLSQAGVCWERLGEIIAYNGVSGVEARIQRFVDQWYTSTKGHKELMLNSAYTHAGGSWTTASNGYHYAAMVFVKLCGASAQPASYGGFTDIADSKFRDDIVWLAESGITTGCSSTKFCPTKIVKRDQMATFLARALGLPRASKDWFSDDNSNSHEAAINRIAEARVTRGCNSRKYCPRTDVTRGQMASFLARALGLPPASRDYFRDDAGSVHEDAINRIAEAGITVGCASGKFCPTAKVKREQMAAFLRRAFD